MAAPSSPSSSIRRRRLYPKSTTSSGEVGHAVGLYRELYEHLRVRTADAG